MTTFVENNSVSFPQAAPGIVDVGISGIDVRQWSEKGYDFIFGAGAAFTANLEASVSGANWVVVAALGASGQGAIAEQYNLVRVNISGSGALGTGTELIISGKVID